MLTVGCKELKVKAPFARDKGQKHIRLKFLAGSCSASVSDTWVICNLQDVEHTHYQAGKPRLCHKGAQSVLKRNGLYHF